MCRKSLTAVQIFIVQLYATNQQLNPFLIFFFFQMVMLIMDFIIIII